MRIRTGSFFARVFLLTVAALLLPAGNVFAQQDQKMPLAFLGGFLAVVIIFIAAGYIYSSLALQTIAQKTNTENPWLAWIPVANLVLMVMIAKKPIWWFLLCLIPLVNIIMLVLIWMGIAEARGKPNWWGIMIIVPVVNVIVPGYLAWAD